MSKLFSDEQKKWLLDRENYFDKTNIEIQEEFNFKFKTNISKYQIQTFYGNRRIPRHTKYTEERLKWLKENIYYYNYENLTKEFNKKFELNVSRSSIETICVRNNFKRGNSPFQKRIVPKKVDNKEMVEFLKENYNKLSKSEILKELKEKFNINYKMGGLLRLLNKYNLYDNSCIVPMYRKGTEPIGYVCKYKDGDKESYSVKISTTRKDGKIKTTYKHIPKEIYLNSLLIPKTALAYGKLKELEKEVINNEKIHSGTN